MNVSNLQLQGMYLVMATLTETLVARNILSREAVDRAMAQAEQIALGEERTAEDLPPAARDALAFPARFLRLANARSAAGDAISFAELTRLVGQTKGHYPDEL
ncbi:MAG: hypothetical protein ABS76_10115 [Pelagibacterium sp. SCN 64-44]|nr:MAG: hypothetical protein ABS76_10115 [Pelagibacterium sp. SCN 64-44]